MKFGAAQLGQQCLCEPKDAVGLAHENWLCCNQLGFYGGQGNLREYVGDHPTNATDPTGEFQVPNTGRHDIAQGEPLWASYSDPFAIPIHKGWENTSLKDAIKGGRLMLNAITPEMINGLSANDLRILVGIIKDMGKVKGAVFIEGQEVLKRDDLDAFGLFVAKIWGSGDTEALVKLFVASPEHLLKMPPKTLERALKLFRTEDNLKLIKERIEQTDKFDENELNALLSVSLDVEADEKTPKEVAAAALSTIIISRYKPNASFNVPLTSTRLEQLWTQKRANKAMGLKGVLLWQRIGFDLQAALSPAIPEERLIKKPYASEDRNRELRRLGRAPQGVNPDGVTSAIGVRTEHSGYGDKTVTKTLPESVFIDVKAWGGRLSLSSENYQSLGMIDVLGTQSAAKKNRFPPSLVYVTLADTIIGRSVIREANKRGVLLYQAILFENPVATKAGEPNIRIGKPIPLNPLVAETYPGITLPITSPLTVPSPRAVKFP